MTSEPVKKPDPFLAAARRMGGLDFCPQTPEAWVEIGKILKRECKSAEHANRVVSRYLEPGAPEKFPQPGEVAAMCRRVPVDAALDRPELPAGCADCQPYSGNWRWNDQRGGLERCGCARGQRLGAMDRERDHSVVAPAPSGMQHVRKEDLSR